MNQVVFDMNEAQECDRFARLFASLQHHGVSFRITRQGADLILTFTP